MQYALDSLQFAKNFARLLQCKVNVYDTKMSVTVSFFADSSRNIMLFSVFMLISNLFQRGCCFDVISFPTALKNRMNTLTRSYSDSRLALFACIFPRTGNASRFVKDSTIKYEYGLKINKMKEASLETVEVGKIMADQPPLLFISLRLISIQAIRTASNPFNA